MLIVRSPMRIGLGGGGTDFAAYYDQYGGHAVSVTINKYVYAIVTNDTSDGFQVISADYRSLFRHSGYTDLFWNGDLALPKAVLHHFGIRSGVNVFIASEVPPGTGLGSSSAVAVTLVRALSTILEQPMAKYEVAETACSIEIEKMGMPIGKQDQYASACGGMSSYIFTKKGVRIEPVKISHETWDILGKRLMLFFTGSSRLSTSILKQQLHAIQTGDKAVIQRLHTMKQLAIDIRDSLESGDLDWFAYSLGTFWKEKRRLAQGVTSEFIDQCYNFAIARGALAGKITGAGGGGFLLLYCPEEAQHGVTEILESMGLKRMNFCLEQQGVRVLVNTANFTDIRVAPYEEPIEASI